jgi:hypothetical protein
MQGEPYIADFTDVDDAGGTAEDNLGESVSIQQTAYLQPSRPQISYSRSL